MIAGWTSEFAARTRRHLQLVLERGLPYSRGEVEAAQRTGCLPVYADFSGYILISSTGELLFYNPELEKVGPLQETVWEKVAMVSLATRYPDLRGLLPLRPAHSSPCSHCSGSGRIMKDNLFCPTCGGFGWIEN